MSDNNFGIKIIYSVNPDIRSFEDATATVEIKYKNKKEKYRLIFINSDGKEEEDVINFPAKIPTKLKESSNLFDIKGLTIINEKNERLNIPNERYRIALSNEISEIMDGLDNLHNFKLFKRNKFEKVRVTNYHCNDCGNFLTYHFAYITNFAKTLNFSLRQVNEKIIIFVEKNNHAYFLVGYDDEINIKKNGNSNYEEKQDNNLFGISGMSLCSWSGNYNFDDSLEYKVIYDQLVVIQRDFQKIMGKDMDAVYLCRIDY